MRDYRGHIKNTFASHGIESRRRGIQGHKLVARFDNVKILKPIRKAHEDSRF